MSDLRVLDLKSEFADGMRKSEDDLRICVSQFNLWVGVCVVEGQDGCVRGSIERARCAVAAACLGHVGQHRVCVFWGVAALHVSELNSPALLEILEVILAIILYYYCSSGS